MSLQLGHIILLLILLLSCSEIIDAIVVVDDIALIKLEFVHQPILPSNIGERELPQGLEIQADVMDVVVDLFLELAEQGWQVLVF